MNYRRAEDILSHDAKIGRLQLEDIGLLQIRFSHFDRRQLEIPFFGEKAAQIMAG